MMSVKFIIRAGKRVATTAQAHSLAFAQHWHVYRLVDIMYLNSLCIRENMRADERIAYREMHVYALTATGHRRVVNFRKIVILKWYLV